MKKALTVTAFAVLIAAVPLFTAPAAAADWTFGAGFHIGDVHFQVGYRSGHHHHGAPDYYYRTRVDLGRTYYGRAHHHEGCYVRDGYHYHGAQCPLVAAYFSRYGHRHHEVIGRYAPRYERRDGHRGYDCQDHDRHYDRDYYERHRHYREHGRRDRHYRDRGHYRGHGRYRGHGHYRH